MLQKLKENIDALLFVFGIVLIVIALNAESMLLAQRMWLLLVAVVIEFWMMMRVVRVEIKIRRGLPSGFWKRLAPGTLPLIVGMYAIGNMYGLLLG